MADSAPAPVVKKVKKTSKPNKPTDHPKYSEMVATAIQSLKERGGSSRVKILKYIMANYKVGEEKTVNTHVKLALRSGVKSGALKQSKGTGATGSFRMGEVAKKAPAKAKKVAAKKPAVKKTKSPKKAKKSVTKKAKSPAKKVAKKPKSPKKAVKKPASKKPASKKPAKSPKKAAAKKAAPKKTKA